MPEVIIQKRFPETFFPDQIHKERQPLWVRKQVEMITQKWAPFLSETVGLSDREAYRVWVRWFGALEPITAQGVTTVIGLFVPDVEEAMHKAIIAGATEITPVTDHDYGYRQGMFKDPFGHYWQIQKKI